MTRGVSMTAFYLLAVTIGIVPAPLAAQTTSKAESYKGPDFDITAASVEYIADLDVLVFEQRTAGTAGRTVPTPNGTLDGAPVLG